MVEISIDADEIVERDADARGRVTLGADYGGESVTVAVVRVDDGSNDADQQSAD